MLFNSLTFLVFFTVVVGLHQLPFSWRAKKRNLLVASYLFYAAWNPPLILLVWTSTLVDWFAARRMDSATNQATRRAWLYASLAANLGLLGFFKYGQFLLDNFVRLAHSFGVEYSPPELGIVLPVGISFYTFQTLSYSIDVYRRRMKPWNSFLDFALYVTFFPQLVAGPIVRAANFLPQCIEPRRTTVDRLGWGLTLITIGLFEKVALSDTMMAPVTDRVFSSVGDAGAFDAWIGVAAFSVQVFFDFSGYSLCAIGAALCLGFSIPDNFRFPFGSIGFSEVWRRWHISLSSWLRDYVYIPLGGSRSGPRRASLNLMCVMVLSGIWHGAGWGFVLFGFLHGVYLSVERLLRRKFQGFEPARSAVGCAVLVSVTYFFWTFALLFFRSPDLETLTTMIRTMFLGSDDRLALGNLNVAVVVSSTVILVTLHRMFRDQSLEEIWGRMPPWLRAVALATMLICLCMAPTNERAFVYFQF